MSTQATLNFSLAVTTSEAFIAEATKVRSISNAASIVTRV